MSIIIAADLADVHFDGRNAERKIGELEDFFISDLERMPKLEMVNILGDYFNTELSLNSKGSILSLRFMDRLVNLAKKKGFKIRVIKGTKSHDNNQLNNFKKYETNLDIDFKIIDTFTIVQEFPNYNVAYIPEEYVEDQDDYYKELEEREDIDIIRLHGLFKEVHFMAEKQETGLTMLNAPVFSAKKFSQLVRGYVLGGHIHTGTILYDNVRYVGSFSRDGFGEEEKKGYYINIYDTDNNWRYFLFRENKSAPKYNTIKIDMKMNTNNILETITKELEQCDHLRIKVKNYGSIEEKSNIELLREKYSRNKKIKLDVENISKEKAKLEEEKKQVIKKFSYLLDRSIEVEDKVSRYLREEEKIDIPVKNMKKYTEDLE